MARQHDAGMLDYVIPTQHLRGSYLSMTEAVNKLAQSHVTETMDIVNVVTDYSEGRLDTSLKRLPYEQNLLAESHIRYGGYGGIGYYHVSDMYIALFSHFIPCGVYEAVYILDGLIKNESDVQPDTVHGDTHAQSTPAFGLAYLLGIKLMPRIRQLKKLVFFRPDKKTRYRHITEKCQLTQCACTCTVIPANLKHPTRCCNAKIAALLQYRYGFLDGFCDCCLFKFLFTHWVFLHNDIKSISCINFLHFLMFQLRKIG